MDTAEKTEHSYYQESHNYAEDESSDTDSQERRMGDSQREHADPSGGYNQHALKTLLSWHAPGRPYRERGKEYYINILLISLFLEVILLLFHEYLLMVVLASLVFFAYALSSVPPTAFFYKISTEGVMIEDHFYIWEELYDFYFKHVDGHDVLHIRTKLFVPGELILVLSDMPKEHVRDMLIKYLPYREYVKPTFTEKSGEWLAKTFPLERQ